MKRGTRHRQTRVYPLKLLWVLPVLLVCFVEPLQSASVPETDILVTVDPYKLPEGLALVGPQHPEIEVRIRGSLAALKDLRRNVPRYHLDLSGVAIGVGSIPINPDMIPMPEGVNIIRVNPAYLTIKIDRWGKKQVAVKVSVSGSPAGGYFISGTLPKPSKVLICGPATEVDSLDEILTKPIDVSGRSESFKKEIALELAAGVEICPSAVIVMAEVYIAEKDVTRRFTDILVEGKDTRFEFSISPPTISIEIRGPKNIVENMHPEKGIRVLVELKGLDPGVYVRRATISLPVKTTLLNVEPELFTVKIIDRTQ